ncbi:MAG: glycosyltransferase family 39 protein [Flavobacteriales bacterium]|nr:glycosyltransferase family 39 protein [Flavobacteriales bacterium]
MYINKGSLSGDEPFSVYHAQMNIPSIISQLSQGNNPPLYEIVLHGWISFFGISEPSVRFPSLLFNCITLFFIFKIGSKFLNQRIAVYASILFIFSNYQIYFSHEARVYSLLGMLTSISMYVFMHIIYNDEKKLQGINLKKTNNSNLSFIILALVNTLIIYAHYFGFFIIATQFTFTFLYLSFLKRNWKKLLISTGIMIFLYAPNIPIVINRFLASYEETWVKPPKGIESIYNMLWSFSNAPLVVVVILILLFASFIKWAYHYKKQEKSIHFAFIAYWFGFIFFTMFGLSYWVPMFLDRYLMPASVSYPLLIAICADYFKIKKMKFNFIIPIVICSLFIVTVKPDSYNKRDVKSLVAKIKSLKTKNTIIYICPDWFELNFVYYYQPSWFIETASNKKNNLNEYLHADNIYPINHYKQIDTTSISGKDKIIYIDAGSDFVLPDNNIKQFLDLNFNATEYLSIQDIFKVYIYNLK